MKIDLAKFITEGRPIHMIAIGGVSMSCIAETIFLRSGRVTGSDAIESEVTNKLREIGIPVYIGHDARNLGQAELVIRNAAIKDDNPEIIEARRKGIPIMERPDALGQIMLSYKCPVCVAGTHGKTTTTSMLATAAIYAKLDPTVMIGATLPSLGSGMRVGQGNLFIAEACEYCDSFLSFFPKISVILNVERDHLDYFSGIDQIKASFRKFAELVPEDGLVVVNADDENAMAAIAGINRNIRTFGINKGDIRAENIRLERGFAHFDVVINGESTSFSLSVPGRHNIYNALACIAAMTSSIIGLSASEVSAGLFEFRGASRRFEIRGVVNGALVVDDYAHHPTEIASTLSVAREMGYKRIICVYQPHTYTRTAALFDDFVKVFSDLDVMIFADIYAAREKNLLGISSEMIAQKIEGAKYFKNFGEITQFLQSIISEGDLLLIMGAGDICELKV